MAIGFPKVTPILKGFPNKLFGTIGCRRKTTKDDILKKIVQYLPVVFALKMTKLEVLREDVKSERKRVLEQKEKAIKLLSLKLQEFVLGINKITDINIVSSQKTINQIKKVKACSFELKNLFGSITKWGF